MFKSFILGDYLKGPETISVDGERPDIASALYAKGGVVADRGRGAVFQIDLTAVIHRARPYGIPTAETYEDFMTRRMGFVINMRTAMGFYPTSEETTSGTLAVAEDNTAAIATTAPLTAGTDVNISIGSSRTVIQNERWFIFDTTRHETFLMNAASGVTLQAQTLVNNYVTGATMFRVTWAARGAFLLPGIKLSGDGEGASGATRDIGLSFVTTDDPVWGPHA